MSLTSLKRVTRELEELIPLHKKIDISYDNNKIMLKIRNINIIFSNTYPFNPPDIQINNSHYGNFIVCRSFRVNDLVNCQKEGSCLCCTSIIKNSRHLWSPALGIKNIMIEIDRVNSIKRKVKYTIAISDISKNITRKIKRDIPEDVENKLLEFLI